MESNSVLTNIKKLLGIEESVTAFDTDIIIYINSTISTMTQLMPSTFVPFLITDKTALWTDFLNGDLRLEFIKLYVFLKVKLVFDPPATAAFLTSLEKLIEQLEFRILVATEQLDSVPSTTSIE